MQLPHKNWMSHLLLFSSLVGKCNVEDFTVMPESI